MSGLALMRARGAVAALAGLVLAASASAHDEGAPHDAPDASAASSGERPYVDADGRLHVSKRLQVLLGIRTGETAAPFESLSSTGEVLAQPDAAGTVQAPQAGRVGPAEHSAWPVAGRRVAAGEPLAVLVPQMNQRDAARRRAAIAQIDAKLVIARINVARLKVQADAGASGEPAVNIYYEQAKTELATLERLRALQEDSLAGRVVLRAGTEGVVATVSARPGDVVAAGDSLFELAPDASTRVAVTVFDPDLPGRLRSASAAFPDGPAALALRGWEPAASQGWRLLFDAPPRGARPPQGALVPVSLMAAPPPGSCTPAPAWFHVAPEWFERRAVDDCAARAPGERRVVRGAALLDAYR